MKNMDDSNTESGHAFLLDSGSQKYHLNTQYKFEMERWVEAIVISMQTAREAKLSLTGACKNIARLVTAFDIQKEVFNAEQVELLNRRVSSEPLEWGKDC